MVRLFVFTRMAKESTAIMDKIQDIKHPALAPYEPLWRKGKSDAYLLAEGYRLVELALQSDFELSLCLVNEEFCAKHPERLAWIESQLAQRCPLYLVSDRVMSRFAETKTPQGIVLILKNKMQAAQPGLVPPLAEKAEFRALVLENVQDPGNVGSIVRTAEALGYSALFYSEGCANPFSGKALRASMGSAFFIPLIPVHGVPSLLNDLDELAVVSVAASLDAENLEQLPKFPRLAIIIGNEGEGLTDLTLAKVKRSARIPMSGRAESLNAAAAAAIMAYYFRGE